MWNHAEITFLHRLDISHALRLHEGRPVMYDGLYVMHEGWPVMCEGAVCHVP